MDSHTRLCMLLDIYGQLLSDRARETMELHYDEDMSLAEIADNEGISRQAVHDRIRRAVDSLEKLESRLGLAARFMAQKEMAADALDALDSGRDAKAREILAALTSTL